MLNGDSVIDLIRQRFSCRTYLDHPLPESSLQRLQNFLHQLLPAPFGGIANFSVIAASKDDTNALGGLGTYGFIQNPAGYVVGTMESNAKNLEDYGYQMEQIVLYATSLGLGTCWLGGSFTRSSFAKKIHATEDQIIPAVTAIGAIADPAKAREGFLRKQIRADKRLEWNQLFFDGQFDRPLSHQAGGKWNIPLEMIQIGPSGSNKQPWRVVRIGKNWHFYLQRTKGYRIGVINRLLKIVDIQRLDMGIAMCHFELSARELGYDGFWQIQDPEIEKTDSDTEYITTWVA